MREEMFKLANYVNEETLTVTPYVYDHPEDTPGMTIVLNLNVENRDVEITLNDDGTWSFDDNPILNS